MYNDLLLTIADLNLGSFLGFKWESWGCKWGKGPSQAQTLEVLALQVPCLSELHQVRRHITVSTVLNTGRNSRGRWIEKKYLASMFQEFLDIPLGSSGSQVPTILNWIFSCAHRCESVSWKLKHRGRSGAGIEIKFFPSHFWFGLFAYLFVIFYFFHTRFGVVQVQYNDYLIYRRFSRSVQLGGLGLF